ncbi:hypothetical protein TRFO_10669 [Tritrichomonas foetus]|uniref:Uncharacterized protein n=1 Tax=Tritrichomonas foetus TaxID=1144522 RepID=A0A1J4J915_9EUKA|nr:hypothetical protein TRFO_10669 [Tritrichomonas foetus]|eukprot:OHS95177.1 hypothetical protein TRFO_10669 [Tritrichomonas foetus]
MQMNSDDPMLSDQSEENNDDFLEGLKEMGLLGASGDVSPDNSPKPKTSEKKTSKKTGKKSSDFDMTTPQSNKQGNRTKTKRRPPARRPVINIDELLDGIGANSPPSDQAHPLSQNNNNNNSNSNFNINNNNSNTNSNNNNNSHNDNFNTSNNLNGSKNDFSMMQIAQDNTSSFTSRVELNIQSYITTRFLNLREDFITELQQLLIETDIIEVEVNKFLNELKVNLREVLSFELSNTNQTNQILSVVDSLCPAFLQVMKSIPSINTKDRQSEIESAGLAQVAVSTFSPLIKENFKSSADELMRDLSELHELQSQVKKNEIKNQRQRKVLSETLLDYESQKITQQVESQTISEISQRVSELRKIVNDDDEYDPDDEFGDEPSDKMTKKLKSALLRLRKETESSHLEPSSRIRTFHRKLNDYREDASTMRNMILYNNQMFANRAYQMMSSMQTELSMSSSIPQPSQLSQNQQNQSFSQSFTHSMIPSSPRSPDTPPRVSFPGMNDDLNNSSYMERNFELIDNVRSRLKQIQDQHDADLQNISSFLQNLKKTEKQRVRSEIMTEQ